MAYPKDGPSASDSRLKSLAGWSVHLWLAEVPFYPSQVHFLLILNAQVFFELVLMSLYSTQVPLKLIQMSLCSSTASK